MLIGIKQTPQKGALPKVEVFYCGRDGVAFREAHAELVKANKDDSRFFSISNPLLVPLQNIPHSTKDHPDIVAAQKKRKQIARKSEAKTEQPELKTPPEA